VSVKKQVHVYSGGTDVCAQYEDLVWGLFMAKYIFPGADASMPLNWVVGQLELAGFEVAQVR
jgi:hypothetical protein